MPVVFLCKALILSLLSPLPHLEHCVLWQPNVTLHPCIKGPSFLLELSQNLAPDCQASQNLQTRGLGFTVTNTLCFFPLDIPTSPYYVMDSFLQAWHGLFPLPVSASMYGRAPTTLRAWPVLQPMCLSCVNTTPRLSASSWKEKVASGHCYISNTRHRACLPQCLSITNPVYHYASLSGCMHV